MGDKILAAYSCTYKKLAVQWLNEVLCFVSSSVVADSFVLRNRQLLLAAKLYRKPYGDSANIKLTHMKQTYFDYITNRLTARPTNQRNEVLFFADSHFLFCNFIASALCTRLSLLADIQANPKAKSKECNRHPFDKNSYLNRNHYETNKH